MSVTRDTDLEMWKEWKKNPSVANLEKLMKQLMPLIRRETSRWSSVMPQFVLDNEAKLLAIKAFNSYNPAMGTQLSTHVVNGLRKLSRSSYEHQSTLSVPEHQRLTHNRYMGAQKTLEDAYGRPPSHDEIADHLGMPPRKLRQMVENVARRELIESGDGPIFISQYSDDILDLAVHDMTEQQRKIFKMRTGYEGHPVARDANSIMRQLGITQGQLSYQLLQIKGVLTKANKLR